jgi:hypothetical protein
MPKVVPSQVVRYVDQVFPWASDSQAKPAQLDFTHSGRVSAIVALAESVPEYLLALNDEQYADYVAQVAVLRSRIPMWEQRGSSFPPRSGEPVRRVRQLLAACPDEQPAPSTHDLNFITDPVLRADLRFDTSTINAALINGEWKSATVLAGSVIEALLLWRLSTLPSGDVTAAEAAVLKRKPKPLEEWDLHAFIEVAAACPQGSPIIKGNTATQLRLAKDYRNLIHPGRAIRLAEKCDRGTALAAVAGLEMVVRDLT